jgi:hypothetical protein
MKLTCSTINKKGIRRGPEALYPFTVTPDTVTSKYYAPPSINIRRRISDLKDILSY